MDTTSDESTLAKVQEDIHCPLCDYNLRGLAGASAAPNVAGNSIGRTCAIPPSACIHICSSIIPSEISGRLRAR